MSGVDATAHPQITLFRGWKDLGKYVWSPFVTKLELRLRIAGLKYRTEEGSKFKSPKGKIPYVTIVPANEPGEPLTISDSSLIVQNLISNGLIEDINATLPSHRRALDLALKALLEDRLYFYHV